MVRRPAVATLLALTFVSAFVGYGQLNTGLPAYARAISEVSTRGLGFAFAANTFVIVFSSSPCFGGSRAGGGPGCWC